MNNNRPLPEFHQKRETGEIFSASFAFLRNGAGPLLKHILVYVIPIIALYAFAQVSLSIKITEATGILKETDPEILMQRLSGLYGNFLVIIFFSAFVQSLLASVVYSHMQLIYHKGRDNYSSAEFSAILFSNSSKAVLTGIIVAALSLVGLMLCILPGILLANSLSMAVFIAIFEGKGTGYSLARSWMLVRRNWWATFSLNLSGLVFVWMAGIATSLPVALYDLISGAGAGASPEVTDIPQWRWWVSGISIVISSLAAVVPIVFMASSLCFRAISFSISV